MENNENMPDPHCKIRTTEGILEVWFSICSKHRMHNDKCKLCVVGRWVNWEEHLKEIHKFEKDSVPLQSKQKSDKTS